MAGIVDRRPESRACSRCGQVKGRDDFYPRFERIKDGTQIMRCRPECIECRRAIVRNNYREDRSYILRRAKLYAKQNKTNLNNKRRKRVQEERASWTPEERRAFYRARLPLENARRYRVRLQKAPALLAVIADYYEISMGAILAPPARSEDLLVEARSFACYFLCHMLTLKSKDVAALLHMDRTTVYHHYLKYKDGKGTEQERMVFSDLWPLLKAARKKPASKPAPARRSA